MLLLSQISGIVVESFESVGSFLFFRCRNFWELVVVAKLKVTKGRNYHDAEVARLRDEACVACAGSGFYDSWDMKRNKPVKCASCEGTGLRAVPVGVIGNSY